MARRRQSEEQAEVNTQKAQTPEGAFAAEAAQGRRPKCLRDGTSRKRQRAPEHMARRGGESSTDHGCLSGRETERPGKGDFPDQTPARGACTGDPLRSD